MNGDLTVGDVMTRAFVGVNEADPVSGVAGLMVEGGVGGAVVLRGSEPVGTLDARDVVALVAAGDDPDTASAGAVASDSADIIGPDVPLREAISAFATHDVRRLVVVGKGEVLGTLSEHDVITAQSALPEEDSPESPLAVTAPVESPDDRYSTQSVCEACGSLAGDLSNVNGQLLCADCREM